jgi:hypothetical protein
MAKALISLTPRGTIPFEQYILNRKRTFYLSPHLDQEWTYFYTEAKERRMPMIEVLALYARSQRILLDSRAHRKPTK